MVCEMRTAPPGHGAYRVADINRDGVRDFSVHLAGLGQTTLLWVRSVLFCLLLAPAALACWFLSKIRREKHFDERLRLLSKMFSPCIRREVWEPCVEDLKADFLERRKYRTTTLKRRWLELWLAIHVVLLIVGCWRTWSMKTLGDLVPDLVRWWRA